MVSEPKSYTIVKWLILTSNTQAIKKQVEFFNYVYTVKGFNAIVTTHCNCLNKKQPQKNKTSLAIQTFS